MDECVPGAGGGRWPETSRCGANGECVLSAITNAYVCQCHADWSSDGDFISAPYQFCHINQRAFLPMWIVGGLLLVFTLWTWVRVMRTYLEGVAEHAARKSSRDVLRGEAATPTPAASRGLCGIITRPATFIMWMLTNPTRRAILATLVVLLAMITLAVTKVVDISQHLDGFPPGPPYRTEIGNIGQAIFPTITYCIGSVTFLTAMHFSTVMWATSAQVFYSRVEGRRLMKHTYRTLTFAVISDWICYLLPIAACIIWQHGHQSLPNSNYLDAYESVIAVHIQWKGLAPFFTALCDLAIGRKMIRHLREHAATQEKMYIQQQHRIAAGMGATPKSLANRLAPRSEIGEPRGIGGGEHEDASTNHRGAASRYRYHTNSAQSTTIPPTQLLKNSPAQAVDTIMPRRTAEPPHLALPISPLLVPAAPSPVEKTDMPSPPSTTAPVSPFTNNNMDTPVGTGKPVVFATHGGGSVDGVEETPVANFHPLVDSETTSIDDASLPGVVATEKPNQEALTHSDTTTPSSESVEDEPALQQTNLISPLDRRPRSSVTAPPLKMSARDGNRVLPEPIFVTAANSSPPVEVRTLKQSSTMPLFVGRPAAGSVSDAGIAIATQTNGVSSHIPHQQVMSSPSLSYARAPFRTISALPKPTTPGSVFVARSQAELHAESLAAMNDFVARFSYHQRWGASIAFVWLAVNTFFAWIPLLRSLVPYLMPFHIIATARVTHSFLLTLAARKKDDKSPGAGLGKDKRSPLDTIASASHDISTSPTGTNKKDLHGSPMWRAQVATTPGSPSLVPLTRIRPHAASFTGDELTSPPAQPKLRGYTTAAIHEEPPFQETPESHVTVIEMMAKAQPPSSGTNERQVNAE